MIEVLTGQALFVVAMGICGIMLSKLTRLDTALACLISGFTIGQLLPVLQFDTGIRFDNFADLLFYLFVPVLIFDATLHINASKFKHWIRPILLLSVPGMLITMFATAGLIYWLIGHPDGFPFEAAMLTGAIVAATDPIGIINRLKTVNAPQDLAVILRSESVFNNASAIVVFGLTVPFAISLELNEVTSYWRGFGYAFYGGIALGGVIGIIAALVIRFLNHTQHNMLILLFTAYASFYISQAILGMSGIMTVMFAGILLRVTLSRLDQKQDLCQQIEQWNWLPSLLYAVLFALLGLTFTLEMFSERYIAMIYIIVVALIARAIAIYPISYLCRLMNRKLTVNWQNILVLSGSRGAIAVALALSLPTELPYWYTIQSMVFGLVLFSIVVQSPLLTWFLNRLSRNCIDGKSD